jgi:RNA exonuclease NGL2
LYADLNLPPDDITYSLLVGETVTESQYEAFNASRVVHVSIDPSIGGVPETGLKEEEEDPDRKAWNCRPCNDSDGLLLAEELEDMFKQVNTLFDKHRIPDRIVYRASGISPLVSVYDNAMRMLPTEGLERSGQRSPHLEGRKGAFEPMFTSYTHYWKSTLGAYLLTATGAVLKSYESLLMSWIDYIFISGPSDAEAVVTRILKPHRQEHLGNGIPKKGVCGSDHVSLAATIAFSGPRGK